jgi:molecular chaperone GrpE
MKTWSVSFLRRTVETKRADVIKTILPALDSFERALKASGDASEFRSGIELIYRQLQDALQKAGVQPIKAVGQAFDPKVHEAIEMVDTTDVPDHHVLDELQRGYKYKDRLLRPAMVRVARNGG